MQVTSTLCAGPEMEPGGGPPAIGYGYFGRSELCDCLTRSKRGERLRRKEFDRLTAQQAFRTGFTALTRHPWLALLPLLWDVARLGLAHLGMPDPLIWAAAFPFGPDPARLAAAPVPAPGVQVRAFLPSALPTVTELQVAMYPAYRPSPDQVPTWLALVAILLLPLVGALIQGSYLGLVAMAVSGRRPHLWEGLRSGWRALPAFFVLALVGWLVQVLLPLEASVALLILGFLLFALLPYAIGVLGQPLAAGLRTAPALFWDRLGPWFSLGWRTLLTLSTFYLIWTAFGGPLTLALLIYPFLATGLVGGAAALILGQEGEPAAPSHPLVVPGVIILALLASTWGAGRAAEWRGWATTRQAAFPDFYGTPQILLMEPLPDGEGEILLVRSDRGALGLITLKRGRFGWQHISSETGGYHKPGSPIAAIYAIKETGGGPHRIFSLSSPGRSLTTGSPICG